MKDGNYTLTIGNEKIILLIVDDFSAMQVIENDPQSQLNVTEVEFKKITEFIGSSNGYNKKNYAIVIVWKIHQTRFVPHRRYKLEDPVIAQKIHYGSQIDKIIHKTVDGEAYVFVEDALNLPQRASIKTKTTDMNRYHMEVLDQDWPE